MNKLVTRNRKTSHASVEEARNVSPRREEEKVCVWGGGGGGGARGRENEGKEMEYRVEREEEGGERGVKNGRVERKES